MREFAKKYFRQLIKHTPPNLGLGDSLKIGVRYMDKDGKWSDIKVVAEVKKNEL